MQTKVRELLKRFLKLEAKDDDSLLHDKACPGCGNREGLHIQFTGTAFVDDLGSDDEGDHEWDDKSACRCGQCDHMGTVKDFTFKGLDDLLWRRCDVCGAIPRTTYHCQDHPDVSLCSRCECPNEHAEEPVTDAERSNGPGKGAV